jgi:hypothetical protein
LASSFGVSKKNTEKISRIHISEKIGFDQRLVASRSGYYISGYFQTFVYLNSLRSQGLMPPLTLQFESQWFKQTAKELARSNPIVIHVRRGDYLHEANRFIGALSTQYYLDAIKFLNGDSVAESNKREVWVFTDSPDYVTMEFSPHLGSDLNVISPPENSDPAESMLLMSLASALVISNSTFSWWAASLSQGSTVVAPSKWFRDGNDPERLIPGEWLRAESKWMS